MKVIFRKFNDGQVIAIFPQLPGTNNIYQDCDSYMHKGQHGACGLQIAIVTKPATPEEYTPLLNELKSIGYDDLKPAKRITHADFLSRKAALNA